MAKAEKNEGIDVKELGRAIGEVAFKSVREEEMKEDHQAEIRTNFEVQIITSKDDGGAKKIIFKGSDDEYLQKYHFNPDRLLTGILAAKTARRGSESIIWVKYPYRNSPNNGANFFIPVKKISEILLACADCLDYDQSVVEEAILAYKERLWIIPHEDRDMKELHRRDVIEMVHAAWEMHKMRLKDEKRHEKFKITADEQRRKLEEALEAQRESQKAAPIWELLSAYAADIEAEYPPQKLKKVADESERRFLQEIMAINKEKFEAMSPDNKRKVLRRLRAALLQITHAQSTDKLSAAVTRLFVLDLLNKFAEKYGVKIEAKG